MDSQQLLIEIAQGQAALTEKVDTLNTRLFGGPGQEGAIPFLFGEAKRQAEAIQQAKDMAKDQIQHLKDTDIKEANDKITKLETTTTVTLWRTGALSSAAGSGIGFLAAFLAKKFGVHL